MKNKWSPKKVKQTQQWLALRWPNIFASRPDLMPLSLSIHKEILKFRTENPDLSCRLVSEALRRHVTSYGYLYGMLKNTHRYDLEGNRTEPLTSAHRQLAQTTLRKKQKISQKIRKQKRQSISKYLTVTKPARNRYTGNIGEPVIRYKQSRKKLITDREIELAS